ncbi:MAG: hypothetical protein IPH74_00450 [Bacteroidetes bacterium]|nr:hypothetical protein [Bacteroidota bacterium]
MPKAVLGTKLYEAWVNGTQGDTTPVDNYAKWTDIVRGSFDPNDKLVSKTTLPPAYDVEKDRLIYTIRFQNTGTDTAFYVRVKDEIPANLNLSTCNQCQPCLSIDCTRKEYCRVCISKLPTTNEPKSMALYSFDSAKAVCHQYQNRKQAIYFDYNAPIITTRSETTVWQVIKTSILNYIPTQLMALYVSSCLIVVMEIGY